MKIGFFNDFRLGVVKGDNVVDVSDVVQVPQLLDAALDNQVAQCDPTRRACEQ